MGHYNDMRAIMVGPHSTSVSLHYTPVSPNSTLVSFGNLRLVFLLGLGISALHAVLPCRACHTHLAALHICNTQWSCDVCLYFSGLLILNFDSFHWMFPLNTKAMARQLMMPCAQHFHLRNTHLNQHTILRQHVVVLLQFTCFVHTQWHVMVAALSALYLQSDSNWHFLTQSYQN